MYKFSLLTNIVNESKNLHLLFLNLFDEQVTIGRSGDVTYAIMSNMISRCHAVIDKQEGGSWKITDKKASWIPGICFHLLFHINTHTSLHITHSF